MNQDLLNLEAMVDNFSNHNHEVYSHDTIVKKVVWATELFPAEAVVFAKYEPELKAARLLDLGVGGGRTTFHLLPLCKTYRGIDYSLPMIEACRERFPQASDMFAVGDVRDLSEYHEKEFNFILFSYNGLDYISHEERLRALAINPTRDSRALGIEIWLKDLNGQERIIRSPVPSALSPVGGQKITLQPSRKN